TAKDAESEGHEGKYFVWRPAEGKEILGSELGELVCQVYDITERGNFEDKNIPNLIKSNGRIAVPDVADAAQMMAEARRRLLQSREQRVKPLRDHKILTGWNALMISGVLDAYQALGSPQYLSMGERALEFLLSNAYKDG